MDIGSGKSAMDEGVYIAIAAALPLLLKLSLLPRPVYWRSFYNFQFGAEEMGAREI